jgi:hypothetical protein
MVKGRKVDLESSVKRGQAKPIAVRHVYMLRQKVSNKVSSLSTRQTQSATLALHPLIFFQKVNNV